MKPSILYLYLMTCIAAAGCGKADAVFFQDKSTVMKADRTGWSATASSEETTCETATANLVLDGKTATYWSSQGCPTVLPYPHSITVDMKNAIHLVTIDIIARQNDANGMTRFKLEGSTDGASWTVLKDNLAFVPTTRTAQSYPVPSSGTFRYLRLTALAGPIQKTFLSEIEVYTTK
ncbi:discoidin domain-containing protein [Chitinophaga caseinilytica]|uniref:discoidin domain-containing protein n=1 Tax=Chitinophaga caseinilytica TaxID=2267521 RepID=UPI003C2B14BB